MMSSSPVSVRPAAKVEPNPDSNKPKQTQTQTQIPNEMKAQVLRAFNTPYQLVNLPTPVLSSSSDPHDVLIKVTAASYCHTDHVLATGDMPPFPPQFPHVGCHEFAGVIVALSPSYVPDPSNTSTNLKIGDRVGVPGRSFHPCGTCFECLAGSADEEKYNDDDEDPPGYSVYCPQALNHGISSPGGFQEYVVVDSRQVAPIPEGMSDVQTSTMMCAGLTIYAALKRCISSSSPAALGETLSPSNKADTSRFQHPGARNLSVGIIGCGGGLGHLGLQFAIAMGFRQVVGVENSDGPLNIARQVVAESVRRSMARDLNPPSDSSITVLDARMYPTPQEVVEKYTTTTATKKSKIGQSQERDKDKGVDKTGLLDAVIILPESQKAFDYGVGLLKNHGTCIVVSFPREGFHLSSRDLVFRDIKVRGSLVGSNKTLREMLEFAAYHGVQATIKTFPLEGLNELVEEYDKAEGGKLVVDMTLSYPGQS